MSNKNSAKPNKKKRVSNEVLELKYTCNKCDSKYKKLSEVNKHIIDEHNKNFICKVCKESVKMSGRSRHELKHVQNYKSNKLDRICILCGVRRDEKGFHYCLYLNAIKKGYQRTKVIKSKRPIMYTVKTTKKKFVNPYESDHEEILADSTDNTKTVKTFKSLSSSESPHVNNKVLKKFKSTKRYIYNPKYTHMADSDDSDDER